MHRVHNVRSKRRARGVDSRPPAVSLPCLREAPASIRRVRLAGAARCAAGRGDARRGESAITAAMFLPCSSSLARHTSRVLHFEQSPLSLTPSLSHSLRASSRLAAPAAVLLPADDFNVRSQRPPEHKSFYGNFIPNAPRPLGRSGTSI